MALIETPRERAQLLILALGLALVVALFPFLSGLFGAAVLYVACVPAYRRMVRRIRPSFAATITVIAATVLILLPGALLVSAIISEAPDILRNVESNALFARLAGLHVGHYDVGAELARLGEETVMWVSRHALAAVGSATRSILNLVIALFGLYFLLLSATPAWTWFRRLVPFSAASTDALRARFHSVTEAMLLGTALTAVLQGTIVGLGFWMVGLAHPLFWGAITAVASIVPVVGSALVWVPGVLALIIAQRYGGAVVLTVMGAIVAANIDNVIRPIIYRRISNVHPMITLVGAFAGVPVFGLVGLLLGPLAISYFFELVQIYHDEYGVPVDGVGAPSLPTHERSFETQRG
ncbi:MAG TPA: AI-2E family transporter [Gemmatimonadaceae bacterium]|nr:AI-2E family transporter [Gemmatimonadaceae bacterium]